MSESRAEQVEEVEQVSEKIAAPKLRSAWEQNWRDTQSFQQSQVVSTEPRTN